MKKLFIVLGDNALDNVPVTLTRLKRLGLIISVTGLDRLEALKKFRLTVGNYGCTDSCDNLVVYAGANLEYIKENNEDLACLYLDLKILKDKLVETVIGHKAISDPKVTYNMLHKLFVGALHGLEADDDDFS